MPGEIKTIVGYLMQSLKLITQKVLPKCPVGGNVNYDDIWDEIDNLMATNNNNFKNGIEIMT